MMPSTTWPHPLAFLSPPPPSLCKARPLHAINPLPRDVPPGFHRTNRLVFCCPTSTNPASSPLPAQASSPLPAQGVITPSRGRDITPPPPGVRPGLRRTNRLLFYSISPSNSLFSRPSPTSPLIPYPLTPSTLSSSNLLLPPPPPLQAPSPPLPLTCARASAAPTACSSRARGSAHQPSANHSATRGASTLAHGTGLTRQKAGRGGMDARWDEVRRKGFHRLLQGWLPLRSPMDGCSDCFVSSPFGPRWGSFHRGVDVVAEEGEPIRAARSGVVTHVGEMDVGCTQGRWWRWWATLGGPWGRICTSK
ncbi:unnamed protein product, partial [Closterium sp. Naga37s-1]